MLIPGVSRQPDCPCPSRQGQVWSYTGGPHTGWGTGEPFTAVDFRPAFADSPAAFAADAEQYSIAVGDGMIVRSEIDGVALDLDKDGNERTGWVIYLPAPRHRGTRPRWAARSRQATR